jgi:cytochrome P450
VTSEWTVASYADVHAVLADDRFEVAAAPDTGAAVGTISWLRASVSRFANGMEHERRRARAVEQLKRLDPGELRQAAARRSRAALSAAGRPGDRVDIMALLARRVPVASMAAALGAADPEQAAEAVIAIAAGYFGGSAEIARAADVATARLVSMLDDADMDTAVAQITLLVQGCDATAGLIGTAVHTLQDLSGPASGWTTDAILTEVLRYSPPVRASRRVARAPVQVGAGQVPVGATMICAVETANRDPAAFDQPDVFDPARQGRPSLTFGAGLRPCPGSAQALALAAGVVDAVRECCTFLPGEQIGYEPSPALRIPLRVDVLLA